MKIKRIDLPTSTIEEFADLHGLTMVVTERDSPTGSPMRYLAAFESCEVKDECMLISAYGNGPTPEAAIADYAPRISMKTLVFNAMSPLYRKEIRTPRLV